MTVKVKEVIIYSITFQVREHSRRMDHSSNTSSRFGVNVTWGWSLPLVLVIYPYYPNLQVISSVEQKLLRPVSIRKSNSTSVHLNIKTSPGHTSIEFNRFISSSSYLWMWLVYYCTQVLYVGLLHSKFNAINYSSRTKKIFGFIRYELYILQCFHLFIGSDFLEVKGRKKKRKRSSL